MLNEIGVNIGRSGDLIKQGSGQHQVSIAKILNLDKVPVIVKTRHVEWQCLRDEIRNADKLADLSARAERYLNHPDLNDIVPRHWIAD